MGTVWLTKAKIFTFCSISEKKKYIQTPDLEFGIMIYPLDLAVQEAHKILKGLGRTIYVVLDMESIESKFKNSAYCKYQSHK